MDINNIRIAKPEDFEKLKFATIPLRDTDSEGNPVELWVKVRRVTLSNLMASGQLPDSLLKAATDLTKPGTTQQDAVEKIISSGQLATIFEMQERIADAMFVEPKYSDIKEYITENMLGQIMSYSTGGMANLERFHTEQENIGRNSNS